MNIVKAQVTGYAFLQGQTNHSGIKVKFIANSPTASTDSTETTANGRYSKVIQGGVYKVFFSKAGYQSIDYNNNNSLVLTSSQVLNPVTLASGNFVNVSGSVSGIWLKRNIYIVKGDITIPAGETLTIQPGTIVKFDGYYKIDVYGNLIATGYEKDTIVFTSNMANVNEGDWNGILYHPSGDSSKVKYCKIEFCENAITCFRRVNITKNVLQNFGTFGINLSHNNDVIIKENKICNFGIDFTNRTGMSPSGIIINSSFPENIEISCNRIFNFRGNGISAYNGYLKIFNNEIFNNIDREATAATIFFTSEECTANIKNNYIHNLNTGLYIGSPALVSDQTIENNVFFNIGSALYVAGLFKGKISTKHNIVSNCNFGFFISNEFSNKLYFSYNILYSNTNNSYNSINTLGLGIPIDSEKDSYFNYFINPIFLNNTPPFLASNSPAFGKGENGTNIGLDISKFCNLKIPCSLLTKPKVILQNNNLAIQNPLTNTRVQWQINNQDEVGQISNVHTNKLLNTEYRVMASLEGCPPIYSEPVSVFKTLLVTTVTITEVIAISDCNQSSKLKRVSSEKATATHAKINLNINQALILLEGNENEVQRWEVHNKDEQFVTSLPPTSSLSFDVLQSGYYYFKSIDKKGNLLKTYKLFLQ